MFTDIKKAYDSIPINKWCEVFEKSNVSRTYTNTIKQMYQGCESTVKVKNQVLQEFSCVRGLSQGCPLYPILFKLYI